jgi:hypothetical protein
MRCERLASLVLFARRIWRTVITLLTQERKMAQNQLTNSHEAAMLVTYFALSISARLYRWFCSSTAI